MGGCLPSMSKDLGLKPLSQEGGMEGEECIYSLTQMITL